jgi:predicted acyltransferase
MAICLMIVVNTPGAGSEPWPVLDHADWFGFTAADIVFPSFLFAVGNAMAFGSLKAMEEGEFWRKTLKRTAIILGLGILFHWFPFGHMTDAGWAWKPLSEVRIPGVLQRIALCYCFAAIAARYLGVRGLVALSAILLLGYWALLLATEPPQLALTKLGNIGNAVTMEQSMRLAAERMIYKMHRTALAWGTMGSKGLCGKYVMPMLKKQQYRLQMINPTPTVSGREACSPIGASTALPKSGHAYPVIGEDAGYLLWRKRNCCAL